jgi:hypothetical protein
MVRHCTSITNAWYCGLPIRYFAQTWRIYRTTNSDLIHEQFVISVLKITDLTLALSMRLYIVSPFWVAKICKEGKQIVYVWSCNIRYYVFSGALSRRKMALITFEKLFQ